MSTVNKKKRVRQKVPNGVAHILSSFNNTIITLTKPDGDVISWASAGNFFQNSKKGTPYASQLAATKAAKEAYTTYGLRSVIVYVSGPGSGRESAIRALQGAGIEVQSIRDITPVPHNGCRAPKKRRV